MVHIRQWNGDDLVDDRDYIVPDERSDEAFLAVKAASAASRGWQVTHTPGRVEITKDRWGGILCRRIFEVR